MQNAGMLFDLCQALQIFRIRSIVSIAALAALMLPAFSTKSTAASIADPDAALPRLRAGLPSNTGFAAPHFGHALARGWYSVPQDSQARFGPFRLAFFLAIVTFRCGGGIALMGLPAYRGLSMISTAAECVRERNRTGRLTDASATSSLHSANAPPGSSKLGKSSAICVTCRFRFAIEKMD